MVNRSPLYPGLSDQEYSCLAWKANHLQLDDVCYLGSNQLPLPCIDHQGAESLYFSEYFISLTVKWPLLILAGKRTNVYQLFFPRGGDFVLMKRWRHDSGKRRWYASEVADFEKKNSEHSKQAATLESNFFFSFQAKMKRWSRKGKIV